MSKRYSEFRYTVRFWNVADECIKVEGEYLHSFDNYQDALDFANEVIEKAHSLGAVEMDINNRFYIIEE